MAKKLTPPALQVPTSYERPETKRGSPMKIAALICATAAEDRGTAVLVIPSAVSPPLMENKESAIEAPRRIFQTNIGRI